MSGEGVGRNPHALCRCATNGLGVEDVKELGSEGQYNWHDWQADPNGDGLSALANNGPDFQRQLRVWREAHQGIVRDTLDKLHARGGQPRGVEEEVKGQKDLAFDGNNIANSWKADRHGESYYREALAKGPPHLRRTAARLFATLGPALSELQDRAAAEHGWTVDKAHRIWEHPEF